MQNIFLSCDWGTSSFRLRLIDVAAVALKAESHSNEGVAKVFEKWQQSEAQTNRIFFYQAVLQRHIANIEAELHLSLEGVPIVISGMASSSIGMQELPYKHLPFSASGSDLRYEVIGGSAQFSNPIMLVSGARTENDVMRGEETQLAGCVQQTNSQNGVFIFPGTHSKHIYVANGQVTDFETYMTGEAFHLLSVNSILSNSVRAGSNIGNTENSVAFKSGVLDSRHQHLLHACFMVRTNDLFKRFSKEQNFWYLSGLVIGAELAMLGQKEVGAITIVGEGSVVQSYALAFEALEIGKVHIVNVADALIRAHAVLFKQFVAG